jgi:hypothetical protein
MDSRFVPPTNPPGVYEPRPLPQLGGVLVARLATAPQGPRCGGASRNASRRATGSGRAAARMALSSSSDKRRSTITLRQGARVIEDSRRRREPYEPRIFEGRVMLPEEIDRIHREILSFERIEAISDPMRELIEDLWPELVDKLPPK